MHEKLKFVNSHYSYISLLVTYFKKKVLVPRNIGLPLATATSFNTATPSLCLCSSEGEHSQPTTDYPDITGAGIIMTSKQF